MSEIENASKPKYMTIFLVQVAVPNIYESYAMGGEYLYGSNIYEIMDKYRKKYNIERGNEEHEDKLRFIYDEKSFVHVTRGVYFTKKEAEEHLKRLEAQKIDEFFIKAIEDVCHLKLLGEDACKFAVNRIQEISIEIR